MIEMGPSGCPVLPETPHLHTRAEAEDILGSLSLFSAFPVLLYVHLAGQGA